MPVYAYKCKNCDHRFEVRQRFSDDPLTDCPRCKSGQVRRVISPVGVVFKGSGFYVTDNRNGRANGALTSTGKSGKDKQSGEEKESSKVGNKQATSDGEKAGSASVGRGA